MIFHRRQSLMTLLKNGKTNKEKQLSKRWHSKGVKLENQKSVSRNDVLDALLNVTQKVNDRNELYKKLALAAVSRRDHISAEIHTAKIDASMFVIETMTKELNKLN